MIVGSPAIESLPAAKRVDHLRSEMGLHPATNPRELSYELLRSLAWASTAGRVPVSRNTLLDRAMSIDVESERTDVRPIERRRELIRRLEELVLMGDIALLGRGCCISAPGVVVHSTTAPHGGLLASGIPTRMIDSSLRTAVQLNGPLRTLADPDIGEHIGLPVVDIDDWIRRPRQNLQEWTESHLSMPLEPEPTHFDIGSAEAYVPSRVRHGSPHSERWFPVEAKMQGRQLIRMTSVDGSISHHIAELNHGRLVGVGRELVHDVSRLMYGLDAYYRNPIVATCMTSGENIRLRTSDFLPSTETRALVALVGSPTAERTWAVPQDTMDDVRKVLSSLEIRFVPGSLGRQRT